METVLRFLKKLKKELSCNLAIPFLGIYLKRRKTLTEKDTRTPVFIQALFNDMTSKDTSKKIRSILKNKKEQGKFIGSKPSYGYIRDPLDNALNGAISLLALSSNVSTLSSIDIYLILFCGKYCST